LLVFVTPFFRHFNFFWFFFFFFLLVFNILLSVII
jgi:hypothetical protein